VSGYVAAAQQVVNTIAGAVKILENNRPQVTATTQLGNAMPQGVDPMSTPSQGTRTISKWYIQGWSFMGEGYSSQCKIHMSWAWGARYNGGGAFIPSLTAWVDNIDVPDTWVPWSHNLDITVRSGQPYTQDAGQGQIYACLPVTIALEESTPVDRAEDTWSFILYGTGHWTEH
jgi:hypothetical protein